MESSRIERYCHAEAEGHKARKHKIIFRKGGGGSLVVCEKKENP